MKMRGKRGARRFDAGRDLKSLRIVCFNGGYVCTCTRTIHKENIRKDSRYIDGDSVFDFRLEYATNNTQISYSV